MPAPICAHAVLRATPTAHWPDRSEADFHRSSESAATQQKHNERTRRAKRRASAPPVRLPTHPGGNCYRGAGHRRSSFAPPSARCTSLQRAAGVADAPLQVHSQRVEGRLSRWSRKWLWTIRRAASLVALPCAASAAVLSSHQHQADARHEHVCARACSSAVTHLTCPIPPVPTLGPGFHMCRMAARC